MAVYMATAYTAMTGMGSVAIDHDNRFTDLPVLHTPFNRAEEAR
jgi:hypothetical protein